jgi:hypothetical protein
MFIYVYACIYIYVCVCVYIYIYIYPAKLGCLVLEGKGLNTVLNKQ